MYVKDISRQVMLTPHGEFEIIIPPTPSDCGRPLILAVPDLFAPAAFDHIHDAMGMLGDGAIAPILRSFAPDRLTLTAAAEVLAEVIRRQFLDRNVVLVGAGMGATLCLAVRSPNVKRIVAVEPLLETGRLWPLIDRLQDALRRIPAHDPRHDLMRSLFGVTAETVEGVDYRPLLEALATPTHVVLGSVPLMPRRVLGELPSLVDATEREQLAAHARISLTLAPGAGHELARTAAKAVISVLHDAARRVSAVQPFDPARLDESLLARTPLAASRLSYRGPEAETFLAAYQARSPAARIIDLHAKEDCDLLVLGDLPPHAALVDLANRLAPGGEVIARRRLAAGSVQDPPRPVELGLEVRPPIEREGAAILRLSRAPPGERLFVQMTAFAPTLMDVRTRLPAEFLAAAPDLEAAYQVAPLDVPPLPKDRPKVLVLQRPAEQRLTAWRESVESLIEAGWVVALEFDDHPHLHGEGADKAGRDQVPGLAPFGWVHAVQTSTPELADVFLRHNPEVAVFPNGVFDLAPLPTSAPPRRVFYGALHRGAYAVAMARSLAPFTAEHPDVEFVVVGDREVFDALPTRSKILYGHMGYDRYLALIGQAAVLLSPLEPGLIRETKSDAKYLDAARAGVPTIASPTVYARTIEHGVNGYLAQEPEDWAEILTRGFRQPQEFRAVGRRAWKHVRDHRMFASQIESRRRWYWSLWERREELTAGLRERMRAAESLSTD